MNIICNKIPRKFFILQIVHLLNKLNKNNTLESGTTTRQPNTYSRTVQNRASAPAAPEAHKPLTGARVSKASSGNFPFYSRSRAAATVIGGPRLKIRMHSYTFRGRRTPPPTSYPALRARSLSVSAEQWARRSYTPPPGQVPEKRAPRLAPARLHGRRKAQRPRHSPMIRSEFFGLIARFGVMIRAPPLPAFSSRFPARGLDACVRAPSRPRRDAREVPARKAVFAPLPPDRAISARSFFRGRLLACARSPRAGARRRAEGTN